jgi:hypothetical protein
VRRCWARFAYWSRSQAPSIADANSHHPYASIAGSVQASRMACKHVPSQSVNVDQSYVWAQTCNTLVCILQSKGLCTQAVTADSNNHTSKSAYIVDRPILIKIQVPEGQSHSIVPQHPALCQQLCMLQCSLRQICDAVSGCTSSAGRLATHAVHQAEAVPPPCLTCMSYWA